MKDLKIGQTFYVTDYFHQQEVGDLVKFKVTGLFVEGECWIPWLKYKAVAVTKGFRSDFEHSFGDTASADVMSAKVLRTKKDIADYKKYANDYHKRKEKAQKIFPEGFNG